MDRFAAPGWLLTAAQVGEPQGLASFLALCLRKEHEEGRTYDTVKNATALKEESLAQMEQPGVGKQRSLQCWAALGSILLLFVAVTRDRWLGEGTVVFPRLAASSPSKLWVPRAQELDSVCFPSLCSVHAGNLLLFPLQLCSLGVPFYFLLHFWILFSLDSQALI